MDAGAMCMPGSVQKVQRLIDDAVAKGATVLAGGKPRPANWHPQQQQQNAAAAPTAAAAIENGSNGAVPPPSPARLTRRAAAAAAAAAGGGSSDGGSSSSGGQFYPPTVITGVTKEMDLYYEEAFGPVGALHRLGPGFRVFRVQDTSQLILLHYQRVVFQWYDKALACVTQLFKQWPTSLLGLHIVTLPAKVVITLVHL
jgi:hypothetical protein